MGSAVAKGNQSIIIFFDPACQHCLAVLANISDLLFDLPSTGTSVLALSIADSLETARFLRAYQLPISILTDTERLHEQLGVKSVPAVFLVDGDGIIRHKWVGRRSRQFIRDVVSDFSRTSRIPIRALADRGSVTFERKLDLSKYLSDEGTSMSELQAVLEESSLLFEELWTRTVGGERIADRYIAYGTVCECGEQAGTSYVLISLLVDHETGSLVDRHVAEEVSMSYINRYLESQHERFRDDFP
ncbi:MAG: TlpA disulfide reductase family protein [Candidatus Neomarinimicrobiota bacterium]